MGRHSPTAKAQTHKETNSSLRHKGQEDEGGHDRPLAPGCCPGPLSYGADGGGVGDVEGGAREDLRGPRLAWIHSWQLGWRRDQPDRALQDEDLDGEQSKD